MKFIYPAVFTTHEDGSTECYFPDLEACTASGGDLEDCLENASAAAYDWISVELEDEDGGLLPSVSDESDLDLKEGQFVRNICVTMRFYEGWDE